ncbi:MAG: deoxyribodipyrimidine photo-lyase [Solirubrobacterales bacterium]|nr:deoxyribodipyrimidine photo-lyase [Solirubrobacterales bacterium]
MTEDPSAAVMWFRRDLRTHDLPALAEAARADRILPCFIFDDRLLTRGRFVSARRTAFMLGCLKALREDLREIGADLILRHGRPEEAIPELARESGASSVHWTADVSPFARARDSRVGSALADAGITAVPHPGAYIADRPERILTKNGRPYTVFSPFNRAWQESERRPAEERPDKLRLAGEPDPGEFPNLEDLGLEPDESDRSDSFEPGEAAGRAATKRFLNDGLQDYADRRDQPSGGSSRLSPWIRWGCLSPLELETKLGRRSGEGARRFRAELAWRDFYASVLSNFPEVTRLEYQERYRDTLDWQQDDELLAAWKSGATGYPLVDAGLRQLKAEGWMHNRVRMVVASFLTKDLHLDWREGEKHFMEELIDGDLASNNGGWQWVASTGTDPAPYFQRMFNPSTQQEKFDPEGKYVRRWVPELEQVPDDSLVRPWEMSEVEQEEAGCVIGRDYPAPVVDHAEERRFAIERYRAAADAGSRE